MDIVTRNLPTLTKLDVIVIKINLYGKLQTI